MHTVRDLERVTDLGRVRPARSRAQTFPTTPFRRNTGSKLIPAACTTYAAATRLAYGWYKEARIGRMEKGRLRRGRVGGVAPGNSIDRLSTRSSMLSGGRHANRQQPIRLAAAIDQTTTRIHSTTAAAALSLSLTLTVDSCRTKPIFIVAHLPAYNAPSR